jgi:glycosyltransferase involved in cell wall biosynthesis
MTLAKIREFIEKTVAKFVMADSIINGLQAQNALLTAQVAALTAAKEQLEALVAAMQADDPTPLTLKPITFIMVARLLKDKGVVEYVQAARRIKRLYPQVRFLLLGDVDTNPDSLSAATVSQWVQEQLLEWPGHVPVQPWLGQSDVFVLPSYREGVPRSTQEAMAMGRPVITTDVPGCRETVVDGDNGYLIPAQSVDALFEAMQKCVLDPEVLPLMGRRSRQMAEDKFDIQVINQKLMSLLEVAPSAAH